MLLVNISTKISVKISRNCGILMSGGLHIPSMLRKEFDDVTFHFTYSNSAVILCSHSMSHLPLQIG